jgi:YolD-like protein
MNKNDRGLKKWHGFFMPESIKMLKDLWQDDHKTPRPQLDEGQIEDLERLLSESLQEETSWKSSHGKMDSICQGLERYQK